jgi:hypothetical protein
MSFSSSALRKKNAYDITSRMQKELQCVGSGLAKDLLNEQAELPSFLQDRFIYNAFHGDKDNPDSIGMVETILSGTGIVEDMYTSQEPEIVDANTPTKSTATTSYQMKDICTLDPSRSYVTGQRITAGVLHGSTKTIRGPWIVGKSLHAQGTEVHKNCKKALGYGKRFLQADGWVKSGTHQADYFNYVNSCMHALKFPEHHVKDEKGEFSGIGKPDGWMFNGYIFFVLYSPRVEKGHDNSKVSRCFSRGDEHLHGEKTAHGRAAANKKAKSAKDSRRTSELAEATSLVGGRRGMDMKTQLGSAMLCAQLGQLDNQKMRMRSETLGGLLMCAQKEKQDCIELLKIFEAKSVEWNTAMDDFNEARTQVKFYTDKLSHIAEENDDRKRSAAEEVTYEFAESLRNSKRPAIPPLHQPSGEETQATQYSQMIDMQALADLRAEAAASKSALAPAASGVASVNSEESAFTMTTVVRRRTETSSTEATTVVPTAATPSTTVATSTTSGPSIADQTNHSFPFCGAGKYCSMPNKKLDANCYDWDQAPHYRCLDCKRVLHGALCGKGEGTELTCFVCIAKLVSNKSSDYN